MPTTLPPPEEKAARVQRMFDRIAPDYDRMNRLLTARSDQRWRRGLLDRLQVGPSDRVLDLACGTGDFSEMAVARGAAVVGLDFAGAMLARAALRVPAAGLVRGDALHLPLADGSVSVVVSGFALRNFVSLPPAFAEAARVLEPGGRIGLLEVDRPRSALVRTGHGLYFNRVVPLVGGLLSSDRNAYRYLPESAAYLPPEPELIAMLRAAGFARIAKRRHMFGAIQAITAVRQ